MDISQLRLDTPGCQHRIHLNNAGSSLMPESVLRAIQEHLTLESQIGGYEAADQRHRAVQDAYASVAQLVGSQPRNIAFTENATASVVQALSSMQLKSGDIILTTRNDYVSNQIQFLSLQKQIGIQVLRAPDQAAGGVDVTAMSELIRKHRPKLVCVSHVPTNSGLVQDVDAIGAVCRSEDVLYLVDACQSIGQMPVDVTQIQCDFLSASSRKFLRGPRGAGFLFASDRVLELGLEPLYIDMRGADWIAENQYHAAPDARRFENWEFAWALVLGTGEAARYALAIGLDKIRDRTRRLASQLRDSLQEIEGVQVLDRGAELCSIVSVAVPGRDPSELMSELRKRNINATAQIRIYAVIDYDQKGVQASVRLSPHYFNTAEEISQAVSSLSELI